MNKRPSADSGAGHTVGLRLYYKSLVLFAEDRWMWKTRAALYIKMAVEVAAVVMVGKLTAGTKPKTTFSEEETEKIISLWSEEEVLLNCLHKDYFKNDVRQNAIKHQLLEELPVKPSLCSPPKPCPFPHFIHLSLLACFSYKS